MIYFQIPEDEGSFCYTLFAIYIRTFFYWKKLRYQICFDRLSENYIPSEKYKHWEPLSDPETFIRLVQMEETYVSPTYKDKTVYEQLYFSSLDVNETEFAEYFLTKI